jgi:26S proteasome regulatory subunit N12
VQVLNAREQVPHKYYSYFLESLADTVREAIADCMSAGYDQMSIADAQKMIMVDSQHALKEFIATYHPEWKVRRSNYFNELNKLISSNVHFMYIFVTDANADVLCTRCT